MVVEQVGEHVELADAVADRALERVLDDLLDLVDQPAGLVHERHPAEDHLRVGDRTAALLGDRRDDDEDPVGREHPAIAQRGVGDIADVDAVDEEHPGALGLGEPRAARVDLQRQPVLAVEDRARLDADRLAELSVQLQPFVVAVAGHQVARLDQVEHQLQLFSVAVAGGVDRRVTGRDHVAADLVEAIDGFVDRALVAGNRRRREHDGVALVQLHLRVVAVGHPAQRRERLALRSGRDDHELVVAEVVDLARLDHQPGRQVDVPELAADADVLAHRAADERHLAVERRGGVDDLLHAVDVGREARHDDSPLGAREDLLEMRADDRLRR